MVATVDENGLVTAVGQGMAIITATSKSDSNVSSSFSIGVRIPTGTLKVTADYEGLTLPDGWAIKVKVDDKDLGTLSAVDKNLSGTFEWGDHKLQMDSVSGLDKYIVEFVVGSTSEKEPVVEIKKNETTDVTVKISARPVTDIDVILEDGASSNIRVGDSVQLSASVTPTNATVTDVKWTSDNDEVATVTTSGLVRGVGVGTAKIKATSVSNPEVSKEVLITVDYQRGNLHVWVDFGKLELPEGWTITLDVGDNPNGGEKRNEVLDGSKTEVTMSNLPVGDYTVKLATNGLDNYKVISSHPDGATVNKNSETTVKITIDPIPVSSISLDPITTDTLIVGDSLTLKAVVLPINATVQDVKWESSNKDVATVDDEGVVTGVGAGQVTITATSVSDSTKKDSKSINVDWQRGHLGVEVQSSLSLPEGWSIDVYATKDGETAKIGDTLGSGMPSTMANNLQTGDYTLTFKQTGLDNYFVTIQKSATITRDDVTVATVTVAKRPVESITLTPNRTGSLNLGDTLTLTPKINPTDATEQAIEDFSKPLKSLINMQDSL